MISPQRIAFKVKIPRRPYLSSLNHKQHSFIAIKAIACVNILEHVEIIPLARTCTPLLYIDEWDLEVSGWVLLRTKDVMQQGPLPLAKEYF